MSDFWSLKDERRQTTPPPSAVEEPTDGPVRKEQITVRLDPGMIEDAREIAARKGIGHHTLLRMWVMEGITRAFQEGLLESQPRSWNKRTGRPAPPATTRRVAERTVAPPSGARWRARNG